MTSDTKKRNSDCGGSFIMIMILLHVKLAVDINGWLKSSKEGRSCNENPVKYKPYLAKIFDKYFSF